MSKFKILLFSSVMAVVLLLAVNVSSVSAETLPKNKDAPSLAPPGQTFTVTLSNVTVPIGANIVFSAFITNTAYYTVEGVDMYMDVPGGGPFTITTWTPDQWDWPNNLDGVVPGSWNAPAVVYDSAGGEQFWTMNRMADPDYITQTCILGWLGIEAGMTPGTYPLDVMAGVGRTAVTWNGTTYYSPTVASPDAYVTIVDRPITAITVTNDGPTLHGNGTNFAATVNSDATNVAYSWDFGGTGTGTGTDTANPTYTYDNPGTYTAIVTASNTAGSMVDTTVVEVHESPAGLTADNSSPTTAGDLTYFTATITSDPTGVTYDWDFGDTDSGAGATVSHIYATAGTYTATVTATNAAGSAVETTVVDIQDIPIDGLSAINDSPTPLGSPTHFTATTTDGTGITYAWDFGDGSGTDTGANPSYTYPSFGTYTATVTATNSSGSEVATTVAVISSDPDIQVPSSITENLDPNGTSTQMLTIRNVGGEVLNWSNLTENPSVGWLDENPTSGSILPGGSADVTLDFSAGAVPGTYTTTLEIDSDDPDEPTVNVPVTLTVGCVPVTGANFTYDPAGPMVNDTVAFTAIYTPSGATLPIDYDWSFNDGSTASGQMVNHSWPVSNTYRVLLTITNCSGAGVETYSEDIDVPGLVDINVTPPELSATLNPSATVTRTLTIGNALTATADLNWNLTESTAVGWLDEDPASGSTDSGGNSSVDVTFTAPAITDTYTTTLLIHSNDPDEDPVPVTATLVVTSGCIGVQNAGFDYSPTDPEAGEVVTFNGNVERGTEPVTYTWDFGGGDTPTGQTVTHTWDFSGTYNVGLTAENACGFDDFSDDVFVLGEPDVDVSPTSLSEELEIGNSVVRTLVISNADSATADLHWGLAEIPDDVTWLNESSSSGTLAPGESDTVDLTFIANADGTHQTTLRITSDDPDSSPWDVDVTLDVVSCVGVSNANVTWSATPLVSKTVTFTGTVDGASSTPIEYTWDFGDGSSESHQTIYRTNVVTHVYAVSRTYQVVMTATNDCGEDVVPSSVLVRGEPHITVDPLSLSAKLGLGDSNVRTLKLSNASTATADLAWSLVEDPPLSPDWLDESDTSGSLSPSESSEVDVTFDSIGLSAGVYTTTLQVNSNDIERPEVDVSVVLTVVLGCVDVEGLDFDYAPKGLLEAGERVYFTATVENGKTPIKYTWDFGDGAGEETEWLSQRFHTTSHEYASEGKHVVTLSVENECSDSSVSKSIGGNFIYLPLVVRNFVPPAPASIDAPLESNSPVPLDEPMYFTATVSGDEPITYTWDFDDDGTPEQSGVGLDTISYTYATTGTFTVALDVENEYGDDSTTLDVTVEQAFTAASITEVTSDEPVDLGAPMHFTATVEGTEPITYSWDFDGDGTPDQSGTDLATTTYTYTTSGLKVVVLEVENAWGDDSEQIVVEVNATRAGLIGPLYSAIPASEAIVSAEALGEPQG